PASGPHPGDGRRRRARPGRRGRGAGAGGRPRGRPRRGARRAPRRLADPHRPGRHRPVPRAAPAPRAHPRPARPGPARRPRRAHRPPRRRGGAARARRRRPAPGRGPRRARHRPPAAARRAGRRRRRGAPGTHRPAPRRRRARRRPPGRRGMRSVLALTPAERHALRRSVDLLDLDRRRFALAVLAGTAGLGSAVALSATSAWLIARASQMPPVLELGVASVAVRTFGIARGLMRYVERLVSHDVALRGMATLRERVYTTLADAPTDVVSGLHR